MDIFLKTNITTCKCCHLSCNEWHNAWENQNLDLVILLWSRWFCHLVASLSLRIMVFQQTRCKMSDLSTLFWIPTIRTRYLLMSFYMSFKLQSHGFNFLIKLSFNLLPRRISLNIRLFERPVWNVPFLNLISFIHLICFFKTLSRREFTKLRIDLFSIICHFVFWIVPFAFKTLIIV